MIRFHRALLAILLLCPLFPLGLAGCGDDYICSVVLGELQLISQTQPIEQAVSDPALSEEQQAKLALVIRARDYAQDVVGLNVGTSYQTFANIGDRALAWNLSASRKDAFDPYYWELPLAGTLPYLGYFDLNQAKGERDRLIGLGYDTLIYEVDAFSTLGQLPDPVTSAILRRDTGSLADTVFHELSHNTVYSSANTTFDESLATFVGRTAGLEFLAVEFGADSPEIEASRQSHEDSDRFQEFIRWMMDGLQPIYDGDASFDDKMAQRQAFITTAQQHFANDVLPLMHDQAGYQTYTTFPFNNAFLLVHVRYNHSQDDFAAVYDATGHDWAATLRVFRQAAAAPDPFDYLANWNP